MSIADTVTDDVTPPVYDGDYGMEGGGLTVEVTVAPMEEDEQMVLEHP